MTWQHPPLHTLPMDSTTRFSSRAGDYAKYRPTYPDAVVGWVIELGMLRAGDSVADIGSGTGISAGLFLRRGFPVAGVEPNRAMRAAAEESLASYGDQFTSVRGTAEATSLAPASVDFAVIAQAFHWFDVDAARRELARTLRPGGAVLLMWNDRWNETPVMLEYEALLRRWSIDYETIRHDKVSEESIRRLFGGPYEFREFQWSAALDWETFSGRLRSASYTPPPEHSDHEPMLAALRAIFERHEHDGRVAFDYRTRAWCGRVTS
jgi:SAM-dependent methyltransferase